MMSKAKVLIVDDEAAIRRFLRLTLTSQEYTVYEAASGQEAVTQAAEIKPDITLLDLGLPDMDGIQITSLLREWMRSPIVVLSVRGAEKDKIAALDAGADDYLTKPFNTGELLARIRAALRRNATGPGKPVFISGNLTADLTRRLVTREDKEVSLTPHEYDLLSMLIKNEGKVLTHGQLLRGVWGETYGNELHMLHVNISNLRRKVESDPSRPRLILTEPGVGYRLQVNE